MLLLCSQMAGLWLLNSNNPNSWWNKQLNRKHAKMLTKDYHSWRIHRLHIFMASQLVVCAKQGLSECFLCICWDSTMFSAGHSTIWTNMCKLNKNWPGCLDKISVYGYLIYPTLTCENTERRGDVIVNTSYGLVLLLLYTRRPEPDLSISAHFLFLYLFIYFKNLIYPWQNDNATRKFSSDTDGSTQALIERAKKQQEIAR